MNAEIVQFLRELRVNNNREWFQANKPRYEALRNYFIDAVQEVINKLALYDNYLVGLEAKSCLFRIYRDVRFSPNKLPYKTHFSAYMAKGGGRHSEYGGYYLHLEPENCVVSGGIWMPQSKLLKMLRQDIYDQADEFVQIIDNPSFKAVYPKLEGEMLTRMPVGFPADSPYGDILRHKDFTVMGCKSDDFFTQKDWIEKVVNDFRLLIPFNQFLNYTVDEYLGRV